MAAAAGLAALGLAWFTRRSVRQIERTFPPGGEFVDVDGVRLHCVVRGEGPPLVLIHGLGGQMLNFAYVVDLLAEEFRVILVDRPGAGYSSAMPPGKRGIRAQAAVVAGLVRKLGLRKPCVVGHSLGGAVALALALDYPDLVGELALIAPLSHAVRGSPWAKWALRRLSWLFAAASWTVVVPLARARFRQDEVLRSVFRPEKCPPDFEVRAGCAISVRPSHFLSALSEIAVINDDLPGMMVRYPGLRVPVRVLFGAGDVILDPERQGAALARAVPGLAAGRGAGRAHGARDPARVRSGVDRGGGEKFRLVVWDGGHFTVVVVVGTEDPSEGTGTAGDRTTVRLVAGAEIRRGAQGASAGEEGGEKGEGDEAAEDGAHGRESSVIFLEWSTKAEEVIPVPGVGPAGHPSRTPPGCAGSNGPVPRGCYPRLISRTPPGWPERRCRTSSENWCEDG